MYFLYINQIQKTLKNSAIYLRVTKRIRKNEIFIIPNTSKVNIFFELSLLTQTLPIVVFEITIFVVNNL